MNNCNFVGRLTKDPDLRYTPSGTATARFMLAVNRPFKNAQGEKEADFIPVTVWRQQAENAANFLKKGSLISVVGRWQSGSYDGQDGKKVYTNELVAENIGYLDTKNGQNDGQGTPNTQTQGNTQQQTPNPAQGQQQPNYTRAEHDPFINGSGPIEVSDDDLPF